MEKPTIKSLIRQCLMGKDFVMAGVIEEFVRASGSKHETTGRRLREMSEAGILDKTYIKVPGVVNECVAYRLKYDVLPSLRPEILQARSQERLNY